MSIDNVNTMDLFNLNNDILGIIQHKVFLNKLMKHKEQFNFTSINWTLWEYKNDIDMFFLDDGDVGGSYPPDFDDEEYDLKLVVGEGNLYN
eukprot:SAG22_NODE_1442_length_4412_cov_48.662416_5_plen_91_part_00